MVGRSELFGSGSSMAPNFEEPTTPTKFNYKDETINKEKQRPPIYNPEDYALSLKKWGRKPPNGVGVSLYTNSTTSDRDYSRSQSNSFRDYRNPMLTSSSEMTLRQFGTVSELLAKLKSDLRLAYPSFVQEFVGDPLDGVTLLLDLLRAIQLSQSNNAHTIPGSSNTTGKIPPSVQRRALLDELSCLQCILSCCVRYSEAVRKLTASSAGLFTLAVCIMSNVNKSRIIALELLAKACEPIGSGHSAVSEALSTLRLRFGEPVRFRFLVGMLMSAGGQGELLVAGMKFLNSFLDTAATTQKRLYIQAELEQAGFDIISIKKNIGIGSSSAIHIFNHLDHWERNTIDVETLTIRAEAAERENESLRDKVLLLERRVQILQEEKGILISLEQCLKDRCSELQGEVISLKSEKSPKLSICHSKKKDESTPAEDEGISSSEGRSTPERHIQKDSSIYEMYNIQSETIPLSRNSKHQANNKLDEDDEETTIDEVMEELRNIINDAETETYFKEERKKKQERRRVEEAQVASKLKMKVDIDDYAIDSEIAIIPSNLHPQPPRKAKSLVHLFIPAEDYDYGNKELFFENEYTSEEGSDSLLSASKNQGVRLGKEALSPQPADNRIIIDTREIPNQDHSKRTRKSSSKTSIKRSESFRHLSKPIKQNSFDGSYYCNTPTLVYPKPEKINVLEDLSSRMKSKSLDRIDDGLDSMVDIVVTNHKLDKSPYQYRTKSDSGNITGTSLSRSISNVFVNPRKDLRSKLSSHSEEKQRMFLPSQREHGEIPFYFPRVQEKRSNNSSFLIKRGHTNAGLYSGQIVRENSLTVPSKNFEFIATNSSRISGKLTDLPSGLY